LSETPPPWPRGVEPIGVEDLNRIGIDGRHQLYWDGRRIEIRRSIALTGLQKWVAGVVTVVGVLAGLATIATGYNNAAVFLCARRVTLLTCPAP
jgi:hypothetical protein